jgi:hypothetical protein
MTGYKQIGKQMSLVGLMFFRVYIVIHENIKNFVQQ